MIRFLLSAVALLTIASTATAQDVAIVHGRLAIGDGSEPVEDGSVVIRGGRVVAAGANVAVPAGIPVVDAKGRWIAAGIVAGMSNLGLVEIGAVSQSNDVSAAKSRFSAALDIAAAIDPDVAPIPIARMNGITSAFVWPEAGKGIFGGQGAAITLAADRDPLLRPQLFQTVRLGGDGAEAAGGSRTAAIAEFRNALMDAADYRRDPDRYDAQTRALTKLDAKALVPVIEGRQILAVHVERAQDIRMMIALKQEFPALRLLLQGASEGWRVAGPIAKACIPVIADGLNNMPDSFEQLAATQSNVGRLRGAGVVVGIGTFSVQSMLLPQTAGNLVAIARVPGETGLSWGGAFATITSGPAEAMGLGGEIGSLRPGRRGDVVLWDGDPLEPTSAPQAIWIGGVAQPMRSRQTELRDRYATARCATPDTCRR